jgi:hypothetical protein
MLQIHLTRLTVMADTSTIAQCQQRRTFVRQHPYLLLWCPLVKLHPSLKGLQRQRQY